MSPRAADKSRDRGKRGHCWVSLGYPMLQLRARYRGGGMPKGQFASHRCARERRCVLRWIIAPGELRLAGIQGLMSAARGASPGSLPRPACAWVPGNGRARYSETRTVGVKTGDALSVDSGGLGGKEAGHVKVWGPKVTQKGRVQQAERGHLLGVVPKRWAGRPMPGECGARSHRACLIRRGSHPARGGATEPEAHPCTGLLCVCVRETAVIAVKDGAEGEGRGGPTFVLLRAPTGRGGEVADAGTCAGGYPDTRAAGLHVHEVDMLCTCAFTSEGILVGVGRPMTNEQMRAWIYGSLPFFCRMGMAELFGLLPR